MMVFHFGFAFCNKTLNLQRFTLWLCERTAASLAANREGLDP